MAEGVGSCSQCAAAFDRVWDVAWSRNPLDLAESLHRAPLCETWWLAKAVRSRPRPHPRGGLRDPTRFGGLRRAGRPRVIYTAHGFHSIAVVRSCAARPFAPWRSWPAAGPTTWWSSIDEDQQAARGMLPLERVQLHARHRSGCHALLPAGRGRSRRDSGAGKNCISATTLCFSMIAEFEPREAASRRSRRIGPSGSAEGAARLRGPDC